MKTFFALLLAAALSLSLGACAAGGSPAPDGDFSGPAVPSETVPASQPLPVEAPDPEPVWPEKTQPEPDYALVIPGQPIPTVKGCAVTSRIPVNFINNTGEDGYVLDIPHLEKRDENGDWTEVPYQEDIGFCGTPSTLPAGGREWSEDIVMLWGGLDAGEYRLSYEVGPTFDTEDRAYGEFTLYTPENGGGLPLAE